MGKNKLARWTELGSFPNVIQPPIGEVVESESGKADGDIFASGSIKTRDHPIRGNWHNLIFGNSNPIVLELGCGRGEYTTGLASRFPGKNFIGVDIKGARMWRGAKTSNEQKLLNAAFLRTRIEFINSFFTGDEVDEIWITFPDPHPGARHAGRRLTSPWYLNSYRMLLKDNGMIHLKTDNAELFRYTARIVAGNGLKVVNATEDLYSSDLPDDILSIRTHYENIFLASGMKITYLSFRLPKDKIISDGTQPRKYR